MHGQLCAHALGVAPIRLRFDSGDRGAFWGPLRPSALVPPKRIALSRANHQSIYVGRGRFSAQVHASVWQNAFHLDMGPKACAEEYEERMNAPTLLRDRLPTLEAREITCRCVLDEICHGDVIVSAFARD